MPDFAAARPPRPDFDAPAHGSSATYKYPSSGAISIAVVAPAGIIGDKGDALAHRAHPRYVWTMSCDAVLVVEDDDDARETLCEALEDEGYWVFRAANGVEALGILRNMTHTCLILLDLNMPLMNGYQFMDRLKTLGDEHEHARHVIVVAASSNDVPPGTPVVNKPVDMKLLLRYMAAHGETAQAH